MTLQEINGKYPVRYNAWSFDDLTGRWVAEDSTLRGTPLFMDPWNRAFPAARGREIYDSNQEEIIGWVYETSVAGTKI